MGTPWIKLMGSQRNTSTKQIHSLKSTLANMKLTLLILITLAVMCKSASETSRGFRCGDRRGPFANPNNCHTIYICHDGHTESERIQEINPCPDNQAMSVDFECVDVTPAYCGSRPTYDQLFG